MIVRMMSHFIHFAFVVSMMFSFLSLTTAADEKTSIFPAESWVQGTPQSVGLDAAKLDALRDFVGGQGCVVRHGTMVYTWGDQALSKDVASAMKPVLSTLLCFAIQEGKLSGPDALVANFEPRLKEINGGKDAAITWRHLACQISGYGLEEKPGEAWSYNDFALALYYDTLMSKVFQSTGDEILKKYLAAPLHFQDSYNFNALGDSYPGRLSVSVRDFARFGYFILHKGQWNGQQLLQEKYIDLMLKSILPPETPQTSGKESDMIPGQRSVGGGKNITPIGPGFYSFNWWLNGLDRNGNRLVMDAPPDAFTAGGHGGIRAVWIIPSLDLIVSWNDTIVDDHDQGPGNPDTKQNRALKLLTEAVTN